LHGKPAGRDVEDLPAAARAALEGMGGDVHYVLEVSGIRVAPYWVSDSIEKTFGYTSGECVSEPMWWSRGLHPDDKDRAQAGIISLFRDKALAHTYRFRHKDGRYLAVSDVLTVVDVDNRAAFVVGVWSVSP
jgi:PAS domain-containing protein